MNNFNKDEQLITDYHQDCIPLSDTDENYQEDDSLLIHLTVTARCNARCKQCINSSITFTNNRSLTDAYLETDPERDAALITSLVEKHPGRTVTLCFYGGEPLLVSDKMIKVMEILNDSQIGERMRYMIYTNGELLARVLARYPDLMKKVWLYSVSIDGNENQHNHVRPGTDLRKIVANLRILQSQYQGNVLVWSTLREEQSLLNCFEEFMYLYRNKLANHFFWHWAEINEPFTNFSEYANEYVRDLESIMEEYIHYLQQGELLPICHINELILYLLTGKERGHTSCGVELGKNYDLVGGELRLCADLPSMENTPSNRANLVNYKTDLGCYRCVVHFYCGGRCPVQALHGNPVRTKQYCELMHLHVATVQGRIEEIAQALTRHNIGLQQIYDQSAFITRYTDVVP